MKEYIERDAALKAMSQAIQDRTWSMDDFDVMMKMEDNVAELPVADVEPVRHGEWIKETRPKKSDDGFFYWNATPRVVYVCSECGREEKEKEPYCNCGAKMDGGKQ